MKKKNVLVLCDDQWHPREVIEKGFAGLGSDQFEFTFMSTAKDILLPGHLKLYDVIILAKANQINAANTQPWFEEKVTETGPDEFLKYLNEGGSILAVHTGACYNLSLLTDRDSRFSVMDEKMRNLLGCEFINHPPRCPVRIHITDHDHAITAGISDFEERDEHYQMNYASENIQPLFTTESDSGKTQIGGFIRRFEKGRLVVFLPGHTLAILQNNNYRKLIVNALQWLSTAE